MAESVKVPAPPITSAGGFLVMAERQRHIDELGFDANWLQHQFCLSLVQNAMYLLGGKKPPSPFSKVLVQRQPEDGTFHREDLLAAGALIAAAVELLDQVKGKV